MRGRAITFFIAAFISLGVALYSGDRLYYMIFACMCVPPVLALIWIAAALITFRYTQSLDADSAIKGDTVTLRMALSNETILPIPMIRIDYSVPGFGGVQTRSEGMGLHARSQEVVLDAINLRYRGVYEMGITRITAYDPFGLFKVSVRTHRVGFSPLIHLTVRPRVSALETTPVIYPSGEDMRDDRRMGAEDTASPSDTRTYREGDPFKRVHWKMFAKTRSLMVKTYDTLSEPDIWVFLDLSPTGLSGEGAVALEDVLIESMVSVVYTLLDTGASVRVILYTPDRREMNLRRMQDFSAFHLMTASLLFDSPFRMGDVLKYERASMPPGRNAVVMLSHVMEDAAVDQMMLLNQQATPVTYIYAHGTALDDASATVLSRMNGKGVRAFHCAPGDDIAARLA